MSAPIPRSAGLRHGSFPQLPTRRAGRPALLLALLVAFCCQLFAQSTNTVRFQGVDVFVDSKEMPLAAYQLEFSVTNGNAKIVGIEGGEHPAFAEPPFCDPKALRHERVVLAAFSTDAADKLPKGKTRVATIHLQVSGSNQLKFATRLQTAAGPDGKAINAEVSVEQKRSK